MSRKLAIALTVLGIAALLPLLTGFSSTKQAFTGTVYLGMDTPLTGPQAVVGQGDRETVQALTLKTSTEMRLQRLARDAIFKPDSQQLVVPIKRGAEPAEYLVAFLRELIPV